MIESSNDIRLVMFTNLILKWLHVLYGMPTGVKLYTVAY